MRRRLLAALLALAACSKPLPPGVVRLTPRASNLQSFFWSPSSRRLAFVEGRFPDRTYLVVADRASGRRTRNRLPGYALGANAALARDGRSVLVGAGKIEAYASRSEPARRVVLFVDAADGRILSETPVGPGGAAILGHPAWSPGPIAVWNTKEGIAWKSFGPAPSAGVAHGPPAWSGRLLDEPFLVAGDRGEPSRLTAYDLRDGGPARSWRGALSIVPFGPRLDGSLLAARWVPGSGRFVLESYDPKTDERKALLEAEGEIEAAVETDRGLFAVAKDPTRPNATGKGFLAPRVLLAIEADGRRWSVPWTTHQGSFLGFDPAGGSLIFAVTDRDRPGVWAIEPTPAALAAAALAVDGKN